VTLEVFQRALADAVASPQRCIDWRRDASCLDAYDLEPRERERLLAIVRHEGMSHNCTLYRANRLTPLVRSLPRTCELLGERLTEVIEQFWVDRPDTEVQFRLEAERFGHYLLERETAANAVADEHLVAVLQEELECLDRLFGLDHHP
jgi:hypothetical protein